MSGLKSIFNPVLEAFPTYYAVRPNYQRGTIEFLSNVGPNLTVDIGSILRARFANSIQQKLAELVAAEEATNGKFVRHVTTKPGTVPEQGVIHTNYYTLSGVPTKTVEAVVNYSWEFLSPAVWGAEPSVPPIVSVAKEFSWSTPGIYTIAVVPNETIIVSGVGGGGGGGPGTKGMENSYLSIGGSGGGSGGFVQDVAINVGNTSQLTITIGAGGATEAGGQSTTIVTNDGRVLLTLAGGSPGVAPARTSVTAPAEYSILTRTGFVCLPDPGAGNGE